MEYEQIKKLIDDMGNSKIDSLDIEFPDGIKISMKKNEKIIKEVIKQDNEIPQVNVNTNIKTETNFESKEEYKIIKSPMVGTFYSKPSPKEDEYVKVGDKIQKGKVVCLLEAMKLMNEIESEFDGEIVEICVENEQMVEYGTPLFKIK